MPRVLIIGPQFYHFLPAVGAAFRELGWTVRVEGYTAPVHPYRWYNKCRYKLSRKKETLERRSLERYQVSVLRLFETFRPELVFVLNGDFLTGATLESMRRSARVALWMFDTVSRLPGARGHEEHVDALFCFDKGDVLAFEARGVQAWFLPQACDTTVYHPIPDVRKDIDILFVGNLLYSPRRKQLMNAVIDRFPDRRIRVYGWYQPWFKGFGAWLQRPHKRIYRNVNVSPERTNRLYNRARVVLNIHQEHQQDGANPRVFEICGAGAWQVCDRNPYTETLFPPGSVGLYGNTQELLDRVAEALAAGDGLLAATAYHEVVEHHSFRNRIERVLEVLRSNPQLHGHASETDHQPGL